MQKFTFILLFLLFTISAKTQVTGIYRDNFGSRLQLNTDGTFKYTWHFHMLSSWTTGVWIKKNDTVLLSAIPVYDTVAVTRGLLTTDSFLLSQNETAERLTVIEVFSPMLSAYGQNRYDPPGKLLLKNEKLFRIQNGRLVKKKIKAFGSDKSFDPWFFKITQPE